MENTWLRKIAPTETERLCSRQSRKSLEQNLFPVKCDIEDKSASGDAWARVNRPTASDCVCLYTPPSSLGGLDLRVALKTTVLIPRITSEDEMKGTPLFL